MIDWSIFTSYCTCSDRWMINMSRGHWNSSPWVIDNNKSEKIIKEVK